MTFGAAPQPGDASRSDATAHRPGIASRLISDGQRALCQACIRGLRIRVTDILGMLANGVSHDEILRDFPYLEPDDIKAALAYAARQTDHAVLHQS